MGQSNSSEAGGVSGEENLSGVGLTPYLEEKIVRDFESQSLQEEWDKFRASVLFRRNERVRKKAEAFDAQQRIRQAQTAELTKREATIDAALDVLNAEFADKSIALEYDASRLLKEFGSYTEKNSKTLPCLGERAHWIDCTKKYATDTRPCDAYMNALEKCVYQTIAKAEVTK